MIGSIEIPVAFIPSSQIFTRNFMGKNILHLQD